MTRAFLAEPVDADSLERILDAGRRAPSAGFTQGVDLVVLRGAAETSRFWDVSLPPGERRAAFAWPGLLSAPVLVIPVCEPDAYVRRYAERDKASTGLGEGPERWPVAYWTVDAAFAAMAMQYAAIDEGLGVLFFGLPDRWTRVLDALAVPRGFEAIGALAIGRRDPAVPATAGSASRRTRREASSVIHRGGW